MSFLHLTIRDVEGERQINASELPIRIGTSADSILRLPGPGGGPVVLLDILDGAPFVQPVGRDALVTLNGEPLLASRRLNDGDELEFYGSRIRVSAPGQRTSYLAMISSAKARDLRQFSQPLRLNGAPL